MAEADRGDPDPMAKAWERLLERWEDPDSHRRFQALALETDRLPEAGRLYRAEQERGTVRAEEAGRQIQRLHTLVLARLDAAKAPPPRKDRPALVAVAFLVSGGIILSVLWALLGSV
ncbi:MAG: hypothetical protein ACFCGT_27330 [Sandaracinaceae bacterium]